MVSITKIGFWGYPDPDIVKKVKQDYPSAEWIDLDIDFYYPKTNILPESYCKIIRNIIDNTVYLKPDLIVAPIGKDKCDSGWFASRILADMGYNVIQTIYEKLEPKREIVICDSNMPLYDKITTITAGIINPKIIEDAAKSIRTANGLLRFARNDVGLESDVSYSDTLIPNSGLNTNGSSTSKPNTFTPGFWGVPPNDLEILRLFPDTTHVYGWTRCVEAGTPADLELEMFVDENVPTVFYAQAFCAKAQLAKYLADKYNGLYIDIDDYASNSIKAKVEAFLRLS